MRRVIISLVGVVFLFLISFTAIAQDTDICPCGVDEQTSDCIPCPPGE